MIDYMLMNLGLLAANIDIRPEDLVFDDPVPDDSNPPKPVMPFDGPIRPSEFL